MNFDTSDWIAIVGIVLATALALIMIFKKNEKKIETNITQKSGWFSKGKQEQNIDIKESDD